MSTTSPSTSVTTIEVEETLARIKSHKGVEGILIMTKEGAIIKSSLSEEQSKTHAPLISSLAQKASALINVLDDDEDDDGSPNRDLNHESNEEGGGLSTSSSPDASTNTCTDRSMKDELAFLRVRSQKKEIMIAPDKDFLLVVIQNPSAVE